MTRLARAIAYLGLWSGACILAFMAMSALKSCQMGGICG